MYGSHKAVVCFSVSLPLLLCFFSFSNNVCNRQLFELFPCLRFFWLFVNRKMISTPVLRLVQDSFLIRLYLMRKLNFVFMARKKHFIQFIILKPGLYNFTRIAFIQSHDLYRLIFSEILLEIRYRQHNRRNYRFWYVKFTNLFICKMYISVLFTWF